MAAHGVCACRRGTDDTLLECLDGVKLGYCGYLWWSNWEELVSVDNGTDLYLHLMDLSNVLVTH